MLSKSQVSFVKSLQQKKFRKEHGLFIAEGIKSVTEFIQSEYSIKIVFCTPHTISKLDNIPQKIKVQEITASELKKISILKTSHDLLALIHIPQKTNIPAESFKKSFTLALDGVQDPGNLGTILRIADWFGIKQIICSNDTVEVYNPKVVQASMGSLARIHVYYTDLEDFFKSNKYPVYGALLNGKSVYETDFKQQEAFLVLGNEGNGISPGVRKYITEAITIPRFGQAESLNVAVSAAIFCSELKRNS